MLNFKSLLKKISVLKDNSTFLLPIIIGAVAGLVFIPTQLMSGKLREQIAEKSIAIGRKIRSESPVAREQPKVEAKRQQAHANDANQIALKAKQSTQRELLSYKIFPEPNDPSVLIFKEFGQRFRSGIDELLARVNARDCPTEAELERETQGPLGPSRSDRTGSSMRTVSPMRTESLIRPSVSASRSSLYSRFPSGLNEENDAIIDGVCRERAESASVYANPTDLSGYEFWGEFKYSDAGRRKAIEDCWYHQLGYWVIEDIIDTISAMNSGSNSVLTSPVKRLERISFTKSENIDRSYSYRRSSSGWGSAQKTDGDRPSYVLSIEQGLTEPCTGRYCNDDIDVIHFNVVVVMSTKMVLPFMQKLCSGKQHKFIGFWGNERERIFKHNQITILESSVRAIDREDPVHSFYRYGDDAVVELDLICEYILNKKGCDEIKPASLKTAPKAEGQTVVR
jgi:hypothetical protein